MSLSHRLVSRQEKEVSVYHGRRVLRRLLGEGQVEERRPEKRGMASWWRLKLCVAAPGKLAEASAALDGHLAEVAEASAVENKCLAGEWLANRGSGA